MVAIARCMSRVLIGAALAAWSCAAVSHAAERTAGEVREYELICQGKPAGDVVTNIVDTSDGLTTASTDTVLTIDFIVYTYRYEFHGREVWRGDRIASVDNRAVDGRTKLSLSARIDSLGSTIEVPGNTTTSGPVVAMTTNYWHAPAGAKGSAVLLLDADLGVLHNARIEDVTSEQIPVAGRVEHCTHYRLRGGLTADLWFDDQSRLVCQKSIEDGYPVELRLTRLARDESQVVSR
jgi:Family of unknown function (DUF6134)